ncbi:hypothetical protein BDV30DRAFT_237443 [Aspergillus minisclerotigenes]|uniref:Uncharacterized protein n=1 Tax=Aspergillus minisclerotigenes TaxID=656917 RepID=A0A5N6J8N4_9EURO|nr:hypothetical protein BDV30DRAFT_237443 [Aspergillus minisclerotigenes]
MPADPKQTNVPDGESVTKPTGHKQTPYKICKNKKVIKTKKIADMTKEERKQEIERLEREWGEKQMEIVRKTMRIVGLKAQDLMEEIGYAEEDVESLDL